MSFSGDGGVERMVTNLLQGFVARGVAVDLLLIKARGSFLDLIPPQVNVVRLGARHTLTSLPSLIRYLRLTRPDALLAAKHRAGIIALVARRWARFNGRIVIRIGTTVSAALQGKLWLRRFIWFASMRYFYPQADAIVAVSDGVRDDIHAITHLADEKLRVIRNPVITERLYEAASQSPDHPWFAEKVPVIMASGRFTRQKGFLTLIRAFAIVRKKKNCRLMILGRGGEQRQYEQLAAELGVANDLALPGFMVNPYAYIARARLFVLSSLWEGSPNVLAEAMALGIPVVATDCPSGPRELLQGGRYGSLVRMNDHDGLAAAMLEALEKPFDPEFIREAVAGYHADISAQQYLSSLGLQVGEVRKPDPMPYCQGIN